MARSSRPGGPGSRHTPPPAEKRPAARATASSRQEAASARLAGSVRHTRAERREATAQRRSAAERRAIAEREAAAKAREAGVAPESGLGIGFSGLFFRFVTCGVVAVGIGLLGHLYVVPQRLGIGSALLGTIFLLSGFVVGGILWYVRDARQRMQDPRHISDERIIFSFIVFAVMPFLVLLVVLVIWVIALIIGSS
jgi:hypothetical protein